MSTEKTSIEPGPTKHIHTKHYGKCRVDVHLLLRHKIVVYEMEGFIAPDQVDPYVDDLLAVVAAMKPAGMIADPRKMEVLSPELQQAIQKRFWPCIARMGVKRNPAIVPSTALTRSSVRRMVANMGQTVELEGGYKLEIALLESLEECIEWVLLGG